MLKDIIEERQNDFVRLAYGVKSRIESQMTPNEPGAIKALQILIDSHNETTQIVAREVVEKILYELHSYNTHSDCDPEWHAGFSEAIDKVEEIQTTLQTLEKELISNE
jgi:hypothetical protein